MLYKLENASNRSDVHAVLCLMHYSTLCSALWNAVLCPSTCCALPWYMLCPALQHAVLCSMSCCAVLYVMLCSAR